MNNDVIKDLIVQRVNAGVIRLEALKAGMITLRQDGWRKVLNGTTTIDEVTPHDGGGHQLRIQNSEADAEGREQLIRHDCAVFLSSFVLCI